MANKNLAEWIDKNFGNRDGRLTIKDFLGNAPMVAFVVADLVMLIAEYRVFMVGMELTNDDYILSLGFILVSSLPFYLGQIFFLYNDANGKQKAIAVAFILAGLSVSGYYGLADYLIANGMTINAEMAFVVAITATIGIISGSILFATIDDKISAKRRHNELKRQAKEKEMEMQIRKSLLEKAEALEKQEAKLRQIYGDDAVQLVNENSFGMPALASEVNKEELAPKE
ncbi:MAG: hypothetical protein GY755_23495 [Chloroflexi bacterium]|nr:hypothetical protein [Chloroflexota bacterium]